MNKFYDKPLHLNVEITGWCNQKCTYCFNDSHANNKHLVESIKDWDNLLLALKNNGLNSIHITGGEPFGYPKIIELLEACMAQHLKTSILSNGFRIALLCKSHPKLFSNLSKAQISLDTLEPDLLCARRGSTKAHKDALSAIYALKDLGVQIELSVVLDNQTASGIDKLIEFSHKIDANILIRNVEQTGRSKSVGFSDFGSSLYERQEVVGKHIFVTDEFCYLPSLRLDGVKKGIWTVEYNGNISPQPFCIGNKLFHNINPLLKVAA